MRQRRIVVALDGSGLAERTVPYASLFARALRARVELIVVWEGADQALIRTLPDVAEDLLREGDQYYQNYLNGIARRLQRSGITTDAMVLTGRPADAIVDHAAEQRAALLVLATHGRSGVTRWWYGSVAADVIQRASAPTLVVGPEALERAARVRAIRRILVPLDGSELSEAALTPARQFAELFEAEVTLAQVLGWAGQAYVFDVPSAVVADIDSELTQAAKSYLEKAARRLGRKVAIKTAVLRGAAADALMDFAEKRRIDLVVMASHGRGGLTRAALGSVADRLLHSRAPVYIVRPPR